MNCQIHIIAMKKCCLLSDIIITFASYKLATINLSETSGLIKSTPKGRNIKKITRFIGKD